MIDYQIKTTKGFGEKVGELVSMLEHVRETTISEISNLTQTEIDLLTSENSNTIGALLLHIAAIEFVHQVISNERRDLSQDEYGEWETALLLGDQARKKIKGNSIEFYLNELTQVRGRTLDILQSKKDSWLYEENEWDNGISYNNYYLWFHVLEDEISHRGQIRAIKRQLNSLSN